jgi:hypothetical protein
VSVNELEIPYLLPPLPMSKPKFDFIKSTISSSSDVVWLVLNFVLIRRVTGQLTTASLDPQTSLLLDIMQSSLIFIIAVLVTAHAWRALPSNSRFSTLLSAHSQPRGSKAVSNAIAVCIGACMLVTSDVNAASYGGFGRGGSAVLDPASSVVDAELAKSDTFKAGLKELNDLKAVVTGLEAALVCFVVNHSHINVYIFTDVTGERLPTGRGVSRQSYLRRGQSQRVFEQSKSHYESSLYYRTIML